MASADILTTASNITQSTLVNTSSTLVNTTESLSRAVIKDVLLFPLSTLAKVDHFLFRTLPRTIFHVTGLSALTNRVIEAVQEGGAVFAAGAEAIPQVADPTTTSWTDLFLEAFNTSTNKSYWGMLHYITSRWAFTCFAIGLVLNRVSIYGSSRQRIVLTWNKRLALRFIPVILLISQMHHLLQAIHCQTSPDFSLYRHGDNNKFSILDWSTDGGVLHTMSSTVLFWSTDERSCAAVGMSRPKPDIRASQGSFSQLWPTFLRLALSHVVENLSCSLQQIPVMTEVGLSVFEHSLAFAEAESMVAHTLNKKVAKVANSTSTTTAAAAAASITGLPEATIPASGTLLAITDAAAAITGPHAFDRINVPVEVLLVALLSCGNALTSHLIAIIGKKNKWRLVNTAFWGLCFFAAFSWGFFTESEMIRVDSGVPKPVSGLLHFPTVAIVGFLPHIAIILGILVCGMIYLVALLLTAVSLGTNPNIRRPATLMERISIAHDNLQAAVQLKTINIRWYEDFYTALLRVGFAALTAASEAVFLNEGRAVEMRQFTWLEEERLDELDATRSLRPPDEAHFQIVEEYGVPGNPEIGQGRQIGEWKSGYDKERKVENKEKSLQSKDAFVYPNPRTDGVGALQRTTRFYLLVIFLRGIMFTIGGWVAYGIGAFLDRIGVTTRPNWLRIVIGGSLKQIVNDRDKLQRLGEDNRFDKWVQLQGRGSLHKDDNIDVEAEMERKIANEGHTNPQEVLEERLYDWWKDGGWFGRDASDDYVLPSIEQDEDATSVMTTTTAASIPDNDEAWESEAGGSQTPTQRHQSPWSFAGLRQRRSDTPTPEAPILDNATLARLLNPRTTEDKHEARILSSHLTSDSGIMTRSRFRKQFDSDRAKVLLAGRVPPKVATAGTTAASSSTRHPISDDEEAYVLEQLLLTRRVQKQRRQQNVSQQQSPAFSNANTQFDARDDSGQASSQTGPPCVVCQTEPRTIIAWPCRCLTVCEDCRVNLAMNNFGNCVTCRRSVGGFVRLYVP